MSGKENSVEEIDTEKVADVLVGQETEFDVGGRSLVLRPRTLAQLLAISKTIVSYNDKLFLGIQALTDESKDETKELDSFLRLPLEHIAQILQMFLDEEKVFKKSKPTVPLNFIMNEIDFDMVKSISASALGMHNIGDILKNLNGLRVN